MSDRNSKLKFASDPANVCHVEPFVDSVSERYNLPSDVHDTILLTVTEAVVNAIVHGNNQDNTKSVSIQLRKIKDSISIKVSDEGMGFNPDGVPDPTSPDRIECCGGRGIFLMRNLSDSCRFTQNGRCVEMRFKL